MKRETMQSTAQQALLFEANDGAKILCPDTFDSDSKVWISRDGETFHEVAIDKVPNEPDDHQFMGTCGATGDKIQWSRNGSTINFEGSLLLRVGVGDESWDYVPLNEQRRRLFFGGNKVGAWIYVSTSKYHRPPKALRLYFGNAAGMVEAEVKDESVDHVNGALSVYTLSLIHI